MTHAAIVVPWAGGDPTREVALAHVGAHLTEHHGGFALAEIDADRPWCKGAAVNEWLNHAAMTDTLPEVLVIHDADVIVAPDALNAAVDAIGNRHQWSIPHGQVRRLTVEATAAVYIGEPLVTQRRLERMPYLGVPGGGIVCIHTDLYLAAPFDPRFRGPGDEDTSAGLAWSTLAGLPWRGAAPLTHLHHTPLPRLTAGVGSRESRLLYCRYQEASSNPAAMRDLIAEHHGATIRQ